MERSVAVVHVGVADMRVVNAREILVSSALGSCVAVTLHDPVKKIGGLAHIMLPAQMRLNGEQPAGKFVDMAIPAMLEQMKGSGALRARMVAKIVGGAQMFADDSLASIGDRNVIAAKSLLDRLQIRVAAEDCGGNYARTIEFHTSNGIVLSRSIRFGVKEL